MAAFSRIVAMALAVAAGAAAAQAAEPTRVIEIIVGASPGGGFDRTARAIERVLEDGIVGQPINVINQPGAGGAVGLASMNRHPGDMHYISITSPNILTDELRGTSPMTFEALTPIATLVSEYLCFAVHADSDLETAADLVAALKEKPEAIRFGFATTPGNHNHVAFAQLAGAVGFDVMKPKTVIFKGASEAVTALLGRHIDFSIAPAASFAEYVRSGDVKCLAVSAPERLGGALSDVPTWTELGYDVVYGPFRGVIGPQGMEPEQIAFWEDALQKMAATDAWKKEVAENYWTENVKGHDETMTFLATERDRLRASLTDLGLLQ
ncbi:tripartite tricarboxylate transporter substrate binding protein (plasmid) [Paracoccus versutus]|uniref:Tricarboxylic transport membrane protein n=1 Tax=Paracoccus versutus TaxID=34007 RepID=A0AAQ0HIW4_PARVE|nr:tripartite tricarboxylate transporter substrate binding protein [Paracoccus versutus]SFY36950.1 putative tricarboxylic transport membrane protein [Paracoccus pantotrophus]KGJ11060.1 tricarboxylate-binding receptor [Paracoccus versutus]RDD72051.1 tripartite tricarboxylate transporter substrate binding protein [Paracoccus versutus]REG45796.1 putative tricarboxylic transport membrane protein [Paracoccus versutus]WEJ80682.1 tripartite tricarboxylate transporter substrate binding protein [Paraco